MVSIRKFRIIVLISNWIEYWSNYSIRFEISNIRTALVYSMLAQSPKFAGNCYESSLHSVDNSVKELSVIRQNGNDS